MLLILPGQAWAQDEGWPPFRYRVSSIYDNGKITYTIRFDSKVDWPMADVVFKIPLPEGTRFLESGATDATATSFDGAEVTFFTPTLHKRIRDAWFTVEVTDPNKTEFTTHSWIAWKGQVPGDYLTGDTTIDITKTPLVWQKPRSRLRLEAGAELDGDTVTYKLYPINIGGRRMWDLSINMPLPAGATFIEATAPPGFEAGFDGESAVFSTLEFARRTEVEPLTVKVSIAGAGDGLVETRASAVWNNVGRNADQIESTQTGRIIVQPGMRQAVVSDVIGDTPFSNYDVTSVEFAEDGPNLRVTFFTADSMGPKGTPVEHYLYIDADCNVETGKPRGPVGAEYWVRYRRENGRGYLYTWSAEESKWATRDRIPSKSGDASAAVRVPYDSISSTVDQHFCWLVASRNRTEEYHPGPPLEWVGTDARLRQFTFSAPLK
ncbi:MAG: hypothetical protein D6768_20505 [Chloroflexi bacterium]|nr:MAG: hypothetical protein D6768_20505 [Chloroflexota bacterium]